MQLPRRDQQINRNLYPRPSPYLQYRSKVHRVIHLEPCTLLHGVPVHSVLLKLGLEFGSLADNNLRMSVLQLSQDTKVREIVKIYHRVKTLHPIASEIFESPDLKCMFWNTLIHDLRVIRRRSQNLADGEITAVQKAFEVLMKGEADEIAAIEIYMDEIIGLKAIPERDRAKTLAQAIQTRANILNSMSSIHPHHGAPLETTILT